MASQSAAAKGCAVLTGASILALTGFIAAIQTGAAPAHADTTKTVAAMGVSELAGTSRAFSPVIQGRGSQVFPVDDESDDEEQQLQDQLNEEEIQQSEQEAEQAEEQANLQAQIDEQIAQETEQQATLSVPQTDP